MPKQMLEDGFRHVAYQRRHRCKPRLRYRTMPSRKHGDNHVYRFTRGTYRFYKIVADKGAYLVCRRIKTKPYKVGSCEIPWKEVGVFRTDGYFEGRRKLSKRYVQGKGVLNGGVICSASRAMLFDR